MIWVEYILNILGVGTEGDREDRPLVSVSFAVLDAASGNLCVDVNGDVDAVIFIALAICEDVTAIPVTFKITDQETIDGVTLSTKGKDAVNSSSTQIVQIPYGVTNTVRLVLRNTGDVPICDCGLVATPVLQSTLGINGLNPSAVTTPNIPQTLFSTIPPLGIVGPNGGSLVVLVWRWCVNTK